MARRLKSPVKKICPKCGTEFETDMRRKYCSCKCANTRQWTEEQKHQKMMSYPGRKPVIVNGVKYNSMREAGRDLNMNHSTINYRVKKALFRQYQVAH